MPALQEVMQ